jgi:hypothetical protein
MNKTCVFCGQKPKQKNNEHIIPLWLIELTGNPSRIAEFGYKEFMKPESGKRFFSFDSLRFPSCESCNTRYAALEAYVKSIVEKIINTDFISAQEFHVLLDWFDKIRVGLWLGYRYLDKNPMGITPNFHIDQRIMASDRMLVIFRGDDGKGLSYCGCDQPPFYYTPSCFGLIINNYCFINISIYGLLARRIGFPYIAEPFQREDGHLEGEFVAGRDRIMKPILKKRFSIQGTELYQPIFSGVGIKTVIRKKFYDTEYVRNNSMSWDEGVGKIFINSNSELHEYPMSPSKVWLPGTTYILQRLVFEMQLLVLDWQIHIDGLLPSLQRVPYEMRQQMKRQKKLNKYNNTEMIRILRKNAKQLGIPPLISSKL